MGATGRGIMSEEKQVVESPTMEQPVEPKAPEIDKEALVAELSNFGVTKADELVKMRNEAISAGKIANALGEVRKENARLHQQSEELKRMIQQMSQGSSAGYQTEGPPIDLKKTIKESVVEVFNEKTREQMQAMAAVQAEKADIETDELYPAIADIWQKHMGSQATQQRLYDGQTTLSKEYSRVKDTYYKKMIEAHTNALKLAQGGVKTPHVEQGETRSVQAPATEDEHKRKLKQINELRAKGQIKSEQALEKMVENLFPPEIFGLK
jgi:competence protein ComGC